jgi:hypothetical protein
VVPTLTWRFLADNPYYWGTGLQYSAVLMPVVSAAYVEALIRWRDAATPQTARGMRATLATGLAVTILLGPYSRWASSPTAERGAPSRASPPPARPSP